VQQPAETVKMTHSGCKLDRVWLYLMLPFCMLLSLLWLPVPN